MIQKPFTCSIPAKTFLLGEYAALTGAPALILTTSPSFNFSLNHNLIKLKDKISIHSNTNTSEFEAPHLQSQTIHPHSPAGRFLTKSFPEFDLTTVEWNDPYQGIGGLGASSAQFIGAYLAYCLQVNQAPDQETLLQTYYEFAWQGLGLKPSGYDVIAQTQNQCIYINKNDNQLIHYDWPFSDITFLLIHSGQKLATHEHLQQIKLPSDSIPILTQITEEGRLAFEARDSNRLISAVKNYKQQLCNLDLIAMHSLEQLQKLESEFDILASKGCGAMGADILLILSPTDEVDLLKIQLQNKGWRIVGSHDSLYKEKKLIYKNNCSKKLEIFSE